MQGQAKETQRGAPDARIFMPVNPTVVRPHRPMTSPMVEICNSYQVVRTEVEQLARMCGIPLCGDGENMGLDTLGQAFRVIESLLDFLVGVHNQQCEPREDDTPEVRSLKEMGRKMFEVAQRKAADLREDAGKPAQPPAQPPANTPAPDASPDEGRVIATIRSEAPPPKEKAGKRPGRSRSKLKVRGQPHKNGPRTR